MKQNLIGLLLIVIGTILFLDELWFFAPGIVPHGWLIGDWSMFHVYPFHHWMVGVIMMVVGLWFLRKPLVHAVSGAKGKEML
jgi:putative Mn2+ efflux pump MntP